MLKIGLLWHLEKNPNVFRGLLSNQFSIEEIESKVFFLKGLDFINQDSHRLRANSSENITK